MTFTRIECRAVGRTFGRTTALHDVDLTVGPGVTALLGPNGAGKSTLLRLLASIDTPTSGDVLFNSQPLLDSKKVREFHAQLGWLPQSFGFPTNIRTKEFLEYAGWLKKMSPNEIVSRTQYLLEMLDIGEASNKRMRALSGGTLRRVGLASALIASPQVLLLDEPTVGLDPAQRDNFHAVLQRLAEDTVTVLSTHLLEDVTVAALNIAVVQSGDILWAGTVDNFIGDSDGPIDRTERIRSRYREMTSAA